MEGIIITVIIVVLVLGGIMAALAVKFYVKTPPNMALIRTGLGGRQVVIDGGAVVIPVLQQAKWISLETAKLKVMRANKDGMITKDRFRVDIGAEFYMRVEARPQDVETASRSLGDKSLSTESLRAIMEEKLVSALRAVAAEKTLVELHENRLQFSAEVKDALAETLRFNGFTLEDVSLFHLDQTKKDQLDPNNIFDAEGLKQITDQTSQRMKERNDIERNTEVAIKQKDVEAVKLKLKLDQDKEFATADQISEVETFRVLKKAETDQFRFQQERAIRTSEIERDRIIRESEIERERNIREIELAKEAYIIQKERDRERTEIEKEMTLEIAKLARDIGVIQKEKEKVEEERERIEAEAIRRISLQNVLTVEREAEAERLRKVATIDAQKELEVTGLKAKAAEQTALAILREGEAQAHVKLKHREAENALDVKLIVKDVVEEFIRNAPTIFRELMEPARNIESIRVLNIGTNGGLGGNGGDTVGKVLGSILSSSAVLPVVREILNFSKFDAEKVMGKVAEKIPQIKEYMSEEGKKERA